MSRQPGFRIQDSTSARMHDPTEDFLLLIDMLESS
jgi:hypothetical protein